jgi:hypothetical protein
MSVASFKNREALSPYDAELAFARLRESHYVLMGPGSPTYAVRQWRDTPIPRILAARIMAGGCLVAASAAALTVGRFTLPVYEIYKVGNPVHWVEGIDVLSPFGLSLVVIPHWNNAEGGTHDTRYCYMGESRFLKLESMLPDDCTIVGLDEHTACLLDLEREQAAVRGIGRLTVRRGGAEVHFVKGDIITLEVLKGAGPSSSRSDAGCSGSSQQHVQSPIEHESESGFWQEIHGIELLFRNGMESRRTRDVIRAILELDRLIWQAAMDRESDEFVAQAREILRDMVAFLGVSLDSRPADTERTLSPLVEEMLSLRARFRAKKMWSEADEIRDALQHAGIVVEDTARGARWRLS